MHNAAQKVARGPEPSAQSCTAAPHNTRVSGMQEDRRRPETPLDGSTACDEDVRHLQLAVGETLKIVASLLIARWLKSAARKI